MHATASSAENTRPVTAAARMVRMTMTTGGYPIRYFIVSAPPRAPMTMIPSRPRLITPECSEKQPPRATRIRTEA